MAHFTVQGRTRPPINRVGNNKKYSIIESEDKLRGVASCSPLSLPPEAFHKRKLHTFQGNTTSSFKVFASSSNKSPPSSSPSSSANKKSYQGTYISDPEAIEEDDDSAIIYSEEQYDGFIQERADELSCFRGLVLDISYRPVNVVCWKRAICLEFTEKVDPANL